MPFVPLRLLVLFDDEGGTCAKVIPRMKEMLEHRAFLVDVHRIQDGPVDVTGYRGIVLGSPVFGLGLKGVGPTERLTRYVLDETDDWDELKAAVFCACRIRPGLTLDRMKGLIFEKEADFVAAHAYRLTRPAEGEHIIPAECMVRIR